MDQSSCWINPSDGWIQLHGLQNSLRPFHMEFLPLNWLFVSGLVLRTKRPIVSHHRFTGNNHAQSHLFITTLHQLHPSNHQPSSGTCVTPVLGFIHLNWISHSLHTFLSLVSSTSFKKCLNFTYFFLMSALLFCNLGADCWCCTRKHLTIPKNKTKNWWNCVFEAANVATFTLIWVL